MSKCEVRGHPPEWKCIHAIHSEAKRRLQSCTSASKDGTQDWQMAEEWRSPPQCLQREIHKEYGNRVETTGTVKRLSRNIPCPSPNILLILGKFLRRGLTAATFFVKIFKTWADSSHVLCENI